MPRHESPRSPLGSTTSKRSHRDDERSRKDDIRSHRHRSRTRSPDVCSQSRKLKGRDSNPNSLPQSRYRDRDYRHRRDRSRDRYRDHDSYRSSRRDRSERRRSRDRDEVRERRRSRDRDGRSYRNDSRERARRRREDDSRERPHKPATNGTKAEPSPTPEQIQAERQKKLEEWKRKQAAERERKQQEAKAAGGARNLLAEIDKKAQSSPAVISPGSPVLPIEEEAAASPAPYAGPFDPKAIAKKVSAASTGSNKLGALPEIAKVSATSVSKHMGSKANNPVPAPMASRALTGNVSGFGLSSKVNTNEIEKASKPGVDLFDDEGGRKQLQKMLTPPPDDTATHDDSAMADVDEGDEEDDDEEVQGTEEEIEARRQRLDEKREERLQAQEVNEHPTASAENVTNAEGDLTMAGASHDPAPDEADEDADPLDAFMAHIVDTSRNFKKKERRNDNEVFFGDTEVDLEAVEDDLSTSAVKKSKKKDIPASVSGKNVTTPFRKNFFKVPSELESLTEEDMMDLRHELEIKVKGNPPIPAPIQSFSLLGLNAETYEVIQMLGYEKPSAIQSQAIPAIESGRDVLGIASTGSGKTLAFLLPLFRHIRDQPPLKSLDGPIALIITPTRELASQITKAGRPFFRAQSMTAVTAVGGTPIKDDIAALQRGCQVLCGTPGRLIELCTTGRLSLRRLTYLVLDEADRMLDMGFEPQISKIAGYIRPDAQKILTSATLNRQMAALAGKFLSMPVEITVGGKSVVNSAIEQILEVRPEETKFNRLLELLGKLYENDENTDQRCLIFVEKQEACDNLMVALLKKGYPCSTLHGGKDQVDRDSTIADFKAGIIPVLIATSVAARGLDVKNLTLVINFDAPNHGEDYVHRCGRTGRSNSTIQKYMLIKSGRAGNKGTAVTFITPEQDRYSIGIFKAMKDSAQPIPEELQKLVDSFNEKVKSGKEKASGSGFGGKGLERLDQERDAARARERKTHKTGDEPDEDENEDKGKDEKGDDLITKAASSVQAASAPAPLVGVPKGIDLDGKIVVHKTEASASGSKNALDKVGQAVASIHDRLSKNKELRQGSYCPRHGSCRVHREKDATNNGTGVPIDNKGPDAGAFHATLEINDFPQKARWAVTNRTNVAKILVSHSSMITLDTAPFLLVS